MHITVAKLHEIARDSSAQKRVCRVALSGQ